MATLGAREPCVDRVLESDPHAGDRSGPRGDREVDEEANRACAILDGHLATHEFVAGSHFSMGDIPVGATVHRWLALTGVERPPLPALEAWHARLRQRLGFRTHVMLPLS